jgi:uncharacterized CHY-type Zn-finger protein
MQFIECFKCHLQIPRHQSVPVQVMIKGQKRIVLICQRHLEEQKNEGK